jgi:predicted amidophosphoribosyltransferase
MQQYVTCPRCGTPNYMSQQYCAGCGAPLATSCPYCGAYMPSSSGFCTNCGAQVGMGTRQPVKQRKTTSGWAIFGGALFALGVLCIVAGPIFIMLKPEAEQSTSLLVKYLVIGGLGVIIGLPLMFKR